MKLWKVAVVAGIMLFVLTLALFFIFNQRALRKTAIATQQKEELEAKQEIEVKPKILHWREIASSSPWETRDSGESFVFENKIWLMGGLDGNCCVDKNHVVRYWEAPHFNDIWSTEDGQNWQLEKAHAAWPPRRSMSVVFFKNKLWMLGGYSPLAGLENDIWQSTDGINWSKVVSHAAWPPREGQTVEIFDDKIWMMGGVDYAKRETKNDVWYSKDGLNWHLAIEHAPWSPRWDHATAVFNGKIFLTAGMDLKGNTFKDVWASDDGVKWESLNDSPPWPSRQGHALLVFRNELWLVGRLNDAEAGGPNDVWHSPDGIRWQKIDPDPGWTGREDLNALVFKDSIWVFEGMNSDWRWTNDEWVFTDEPDPTSTTISPVSGNAPSFNSRNQLAQIIKIETDLLRKWQQAGSFKNNLAYDAAGSDVTLLQRMLSEDSGIYPEKRITGYYGDLTIQAVKRFQAEYGLTITGLVDSATREKLNGVFLSHLCPEPRAAYPDFTMRKVTLSLPLPADYVPPSLEDISAKVKTMGTVCLRSDITPHLALMFSDAKREGINFMITSGYRKPEVQKYLYDFWIQLEGEDALDEIAKPGYSEHQLGTAVDLTDDSIGFAGVDPRFAMSDGGIWLQKNAYRYGFIMSYPNEKRLQTGYKYESWHWRYVGVLSATSLHNKGITFNELPSSGGAYPAQKDNIDGLSVSADSLISVFVNNDGTERVLLEKNKDRQLPIASITKLMVALVAMDQFNSSDTIAITEESLKNRGASGIYKAGERFLFRDALRALLVGSHNEIAESFAGIISADKFLGLMNSRAMQLNLSKTNFVDAAGLDPEQGSDFINLSTASDISHLMRYISERQPEILSTTMRPRYYLFDANGNFVKTIVNTDELVNDRDLPFTILGGKTGETPRAKKNLAIVSRTPNGGKIISIVLGSQDNFGDMKKLLWYINNSFSW